MFVELIFNNKYISSANLLEDCSYETLQNIVSNITNVPVDDLYATQNGRILTSWSTISPEYSIKWNTKLVGGKGGFGSMLRAIGAQIEKTTNREACRDLSGRRLRDIRQEQRLREWAATRQDREEEQRRRKEDRLKRMCAIPSHEFSDPAYEEARKALEEKGGESVEAGMKATAPSTQSSQAKQPKKNLKKKPKLWIDEDLSDLSSSESGCEEDEDLKRKRPTATTVSSPSSIKGKGIGKKSKPEVSCSSSGDSPAQVSSDDGIAADGQTTESSNDSDQDNIPLKK